MPISATTVQKTFKLEATTLFARANVGAAGSISSTITANGASKGVTLSKLATAKYRATIDPQIPVQQFLGAPVVQVLSTSDAGSAIYNGRVFGENAANGTVDFIFYGDDGALINLPDGSQLLVTIFLTTSPVF